MKTFNKILIACFTFFLVQSSHAFYLSNDFKSYWAGIEVMGTDHETAMKIRRLIPIKVGDIFYLSNKTSYKTACLKAINENFSFDEVSCSFLVFGEGTSYVVVDIIQSGTPKPIFRSIPEVDSGVPKLPKNAILLFNQWNQRFSTLMSTGSFPVEKFDKDYIDYEDPTLHLLALKLHKIASQNNKLLLEIVRFSPDVEERNIAAILLSWAAHLENLSYILKWELLSDPEEKVRNNLARSYSLFLHNIQDKALLKQSFSAFCKLAALPSHSDRNKALFSIADILKTHPELASLIDKECKTTIKYISRASILDNVGDVAKDIMHTIDSSTNS